MEPTALSANPNPRRIAVVGLWHLGCVTAACLAEAGYEVLAVDPDTTVVEGLTHGRPPISEPGLAELIEANSQRLHFTAEPRALEQTACAWVTFDTPVDDDDTAEVEWVLDNAARLLTKLPEAALVIVSSQLPVGSIAQLEVRCADRRGRGDLRFACLPENLRLGNALEAFREPDRIVAGVRCERDRLQLAELLAPFDAEIQWMGVESAEMTKHALNSFLATSVAFINEIAAICESVGADAAEVARGLKSERRIGPGAYLGPGDAFAGGTLARDVVFLRTLAKRHGLSDRVLAGVFDGNDAHRRWTRRKLIELLGNDGPREYALLGRTVAIWGLTYKPGTDTLRRSSAIELCRWLIGAGAEVRAHDPVVNSLPADLAGAVQLCPDPVQSVERADALVVCTAWPDYREIPPERIASALGNGLVLDTAGWLRASFAARPDVRYVCVGMPSRPRRTAPETPAEVLW